MQDYQKMLEEAFDLIRDLPDADLQKLMDDLDAMP